MESDVRSMYTASISASVRQAANLALLEVDRGKLHLSIQLIPSVLIFFVPTIIMLFLDLC